MSGFEYHNPERKTTETKQGCGFCPKCGKPRANGGKFCKYCGFKFETQGRSEKHHSSREEEMAAGRKTSFFTSKRNRIIIAGTLICIIVVIAVAQFGIFTGHGNMPLKNPEVKRAAEVVHPTATETPKESIRSTEVIKPTEAVHPTEVAKPAEADAAVEVGQTIRFGSYEQDNNLSNGKEEIEWIVLAKENNKMLVISKFCLEAKAYNEKGGSATWEGSTLREWLNSSFLNSAFSEEEKNQISVTTVSPDNDPEYDTGLEKDTNDKIFLLSMKEAKKYFSSDDERMAKATAYAIASGPDMLTYKHEEWGESGNEKWDGNCFWWLRSPSYLNLLDIGRYTEMNVALQGNINIQGHGVANDCDTVRPAMWINMES